MVVYTCNPSTCESEASLGYIDQSVEAGLKRKEIEVQGGRKEDWLYSKNDSCPAIYLRIRLY